MYIRCTYKSAMLMRATDVHVFLPFHDGYPDAQVPYPTLYFLPGYSANAEELATCLPFRQMSAKYGVAVVILNGENSFYTDHPERATLHGSFAGNELVTVTRNLFPRLSCKREDTFIGGISMGGYGAATLGLRYNDTFSRIIMLSPAINPEELLTHSRSTQSGSVPPQLFESLLGGEETYRNSWMNPSKAILQCKRENLPALYLCCGKQDALVGDACATFQSFLQEQKISFDWEDGDGGHDIPYWDTKLENAFRFLGRKEL